MNNSKIGNLLAYISSQVNNINLRKLIKLVFLIDEESVKTRGISVTWLNYYVWEKGPVAPCIYDIKHNGGIFSNFVKVHRNREEKVIVTSAINVSESSFYFSKKELRLINSILEQYGKRDADELSALTHNPGGLWATAKEKYNPNFKSTNGKTNIELDLKDLIKGNEEKISVYNDAYEIAQMC